MSNREAKKESSGVLLTIVMLSAAAFCGIDGSIAGSLNSFGQQTDIDPDIAPCYRPDTDAVDETMGQHQVRRFSDYAYLSDSERDSLRHEIVRFLTQDTMDARVHSNDTINISPISDRPVFRKLVTTSANYISPPNSHARFYEGWGYGTRIYFPDHANELREYSGVSGSDWSTSSPDSLIQLVLDGSYIRHRKCGLVEINGVDSIQCYPQSIDASPSEPIPSTGVIFVDSKVWLSASRGRVDRMDGEIPERSNDDGGFISDGFTGQITIGSSDTMIITDNLVYQHSNANFSVPTVMDSCSDILGLVSERYIMVGKNVSETVYIHAAVAALAGSFSVQDIYMNLAPGWDNEKQSLLIWGSIAQRNRGIIHSSDFPPGHFRGFIEKYYKYDVRFRIQAPPHFPSVQEINYEYNHEVSGNGEEFGQ